MDGVDTGFADIVPADGIPGRGGVRRSFCDPGGDVKTLLGRFFALDDFGFDPLSGLPGSAAAFFTVEA